MSTHDEHKDIKKRSLISVMSLFFQSGYSAMLGLAANLILGILLSPAIFGIYGTVLSIISLLNYFSDLGLAASLIQKKEISDDDIRTTFTVQQLLIITIITIGFLGTPFVGSFYKLPQEGMFLYWALLVSFFISSLKTIPSILLERKILFRKIVLVQITENTVFYLSVILFALMGYGIKSFTFAVVIRAIVGLVMIYSISFWKPQIGISRKSLHSLLSFGIPFQASSFLALFKDDLINLYLAKVLGFHNFGYIIWAKKWAEAPIRIIMDSVSRVLFPVLARIQNDKGKVGKLLEKILYYQTLILAPTLFGLALVINSFVMIIPKYGKWAPALPAFYIFVLAAFLSTYSTPFINLFNALGKVKISFTFMFVWTVTTWICTPIFTKMFGLLGFPMTQLILALTSILVAFRARQIVPFSIFRPLYPLIISSGIMGILVGLIINITGGNLLGIIISVVVGILLYAGSLLVIFKINVVQEAFKIFH